MMPRQASEHFVVAVLTLLMSLRSPSTPIEWVAWKPRPPGPRQRCLRPGTRWPRDSGRHCSPSAGWWLGNQSAPSRRGGPPLEVALGRKSTPKVGGWATDRPKVEGGGRNPGTGGRKATRQIDGRATDPLKVDGVGRHFGWGVGRKATPRSSALRPAHRRPRGEVTFWGSSGPEGDPQGWRIGNG